MIGKAAGRIALGAALAAGPACGDPSPAKDAADKPIVAEPAPEPLHLHNGFMPDPLIVDGSTIGIAAAASWDERCTGFVDPANPVVIVTDDAREATAALRDLVVRTLQDVRRLAVELRPSALDDFGLVPAIERLAGTLAEQSELVVDLEARLGDQRLPPEAETALYRIVQEALTNVVKHASATRVSITLVRKEASAVVVIEDDGRGFDPEAVRAGALGFTGMRERVELVGGRLTVETSPGAGTTLVAEVRVASGAPAEEAGA